MTDPAGKWKVYEVDALGKLVRVREQSPKADEADHVTTYAYNLLGQLTTVTMPRATGTQTRMFSYDTTTYRLTSETHPEKGTTSYLYNSDGRRRTRAGGT